MTNTDPINKIGGEHRCPRKASILIRHPSCYWW